MVPDMKHSFEIEIREDGREPALHGVVLQEGRPARRLPEVFAPNSVSWPESGISIMTTHHGKEEIRAHPVRASNGEIRIHARLTNALRRAIEGGKKFMSLEFVALESRNLESGVREITQAMMTGATVTDRPAYEQTRAEIREQKRRRRIWL